MVFDGVVQERSDGHIFGDRKIDVAGFAQHQRSHTQQVRHDGDARSFAGFNVEVPGIVDRLHEAVSKVNRQALRCVFQGSRGHFSFNFLSGILK